MLDFFLNAIIIASNQLHLRSVANIIRPSISESKFLFLQGLAKYVFKYVLFAYVIYNNKNGSK